MPGYHCPSNSLIRAGRLQRVRELISSCGQSVFQKWSKGYLFLCDAVKIKQTEIAKLLLRLGFKVNSNNQTTDTPLHFAAINGDIEIVQMLIDRGANINAENQCGNTPLHNAVKSKKIEIIELLLNQGACVNCTDSNNITPLHLALEGCSEEIIKLLLSRVTNFDTTGNDGGTYIHIAAERGYLQIVEHLLQHGAYVDSAYTSTYREGYTPLCLAVKEGHEEVVQLLLECGANVNAQGKDGKTVLHFAVEERNAKIVTLLLQCGANVDAQDKDGKTALHFAVEKGNEKVVKLLLECGANVDAQDKDGKTVLHMAVEKGCSVIIEHVLKHCPDVNNRSNRSALKVAVHGSGKEYGKIVENLLQYGFTVSPEDVNNCKLLHAAVEKGYLKIVEELLKYGTDVNMLYKPTYGRGYMPLHVAAKNKQEEVAKLLIKYGADVNAQDETGKNPIFYATQNADLKIAKLLLTNKATIKANPELLNIAVLKECREIVEVLLEHGADVNASDKYGRTALHFTGLFEGGRFFRNEDPDANVRGEIAKLLLSRGANVNAETKNGITMLHAATQEGYVNDEALLEHNADVNSTVKVDEDYLKFGASFNSNAEYGRTALHFAAENGCLEVVKILLKFGANIDSQDGDGRTALHLACKEMHKQIVITLLEQGSDINIMSKNNETPFYIVADVRACYSKYFYYGSDDDDDIQTFAFEIIFEILKCHVVKMKAANLFLCKKNLMFISYNDEISDFQKECEEEIASMKSENVSNANVSFYDILTEGVSQLAMYAGNDSIVQILRSDDYKVKFPIYASMINCNFRKGERRKNLLEQGNKIFLFNIIPQLPHDCTEKIFSYLSDEDLRILIGACKPVSGSSPNTDTNNAVIA